MSDVHLDFNSTTVDRATRGAGIIEAIDRGLAEREADEPIRSYLGASYLGDACERAIQWQSMAEPADAGLGPSPQTLRIFERGHRFEEMAIGWMRHAGFALKTHGADGRQFGFQAAGGRFRGHADGVLVGWAGEGAAPIEMPALWEHKALGAKSWASIRSRGVRKAKPTYFAQIQVYQYQLQLTENPAVFMTTNADTMEVHVELVRFDPAECQSLIDRAARVLRATEAGETLPRVATDPEHFVCRMCRYRRRCWGG